MQDPDERPGRREGGSPVKPLGTTGVPRETLLPLGLLIVAFVVAIVQPWGAVGPARPGPDGRLESAPVTGSGRGLATTDPRTPRPEDPFEELVVTCGYPTGWRAATLQGWAGRESPIRSWIAVDPVAAAGAFDPTIPFAPVATDLVLAIGYCSPVDTSRPPSAVDVEVWSVPEDGPPQRLTGLARLEPVHPNALGGLWLPPDASTVTADGADGWAPGRYAIRVVALPFDRWLGIEIRDISGRRPTPSARPSSSPITPPSPTETASP